MANTIKFKRGSGSDPGTSDLSVGEIAIRTDTAKLFTKNDAGSVVSVSGGVEDGDKGDITVSSSGSVFTIDSGVVTSAKIANDTIVNADINSSAAIAGSKIDPDFGSQNVVTTGTLSSGNITVSSNLPKLFLTDANNNSDFSVQNTNGVFTVHDETNTADRLTINSSGLVTVSGNLDCSSGVDVTGDITVSGTVDGRDVAADGTKLDGIESGATADQTKSDIDALGIAASTAATLATARNIGGVSFNGSANINLPGVNTSGNQDTSGNAATATALETARTIAGVSFDGSANISLNNNAITNGAGYITDLVNDTSPQLGGDLDTNDHHIVLDEDHYLYFITNGGSAFLGKTASGLFLQNNGDLFLRGDDVYIRGDNNENCAVFKENGAAELYFDNNKKLETTSGGATITGTCTATAFSGDGSALTGISAGATGGGSDEIFYENGQNVTTDYTITNGKNAMSAGPITIDSGVTVTVGAGETLTIV